MKHRLTRLALAALFIIPAGLGLSSCGTGKDDRNKMLVSVRDQRMLLVRDGRNHLGATAHECGLFGVLVNLPVTARRATLSCPFER